MDQNTWSPIAKIYDPLMVGSIDTTDEEPHDHGIVRAMNSKYKPNKDVVGDPHKTIFVARLNPKTADETLHDEFSFFGEIKNLRLVRDIVTGISKCYAFVEYIDEKSAYRAQRDGNKMVIDGSEIFVDFELERNLKGWIPRRLGGGFGGNKESGQLRFGGKDRPFRPPITGNSDTRNNFTSDRSRFREESYNDKRNDKYSVSKRDKRDRSKDRSSRSREKRDRSRDRNKNKKHNHDRDRRRSRSQDK
ncbi:hypothetical protein KUTeg_011261 [Tegillarca granosa]|uniref:RRM domain-containing protein n=1 Tax=Tegillarca granosa TaxID=220873 RepID=A0ABQ9F5K3_TEGGR|nr:hypothetical protein KUTeg_011261 [Tegillarca granosa]